MSHPSQVIVDAVAAIQREDWKAFIELCDPASVRRFKNDLVWQFSDHGYSPPFTVDEFLSDEPDISREVAEYYFSEMNGQRDPAFRLSLEMRTVSSLEELESLEPTEIRSTEYSCPKPSSKVLRSSLSTSRLRNTKDQSAKFSARRVHGVLRACGEMISRVGYG